MSWLKCFIVTLGLLLCASGATAKKIEQFTDSEGTVHITNPASEKADKEDPAAGKIMPRSRRPINPYSAPGSSRSPRPSPYVNPPPEPVIETPAIEAPEPGTDR
jgi:hypothetical protein